MKKLPLSFFSRDTVTVARDLLGKIVEVNGCRARIVETEAYGKDPASHAYTKTPRSRIMFDTYGHAYVYLIYGMYNCLNFTTERESKPGAVLIRAVEPISGIEDMKARRKTEALTKLCSGPGKLCTAFGIDRSFNGLELGRVMKVFDDGFIVNKICKSSRVGIKDALELKWRFFIKDNKFVSR